MQVLSCKMRVGWLLAVVIGCCGQMVLAQPANDQCADAEVINIGSTPFSTIGADTDGPAHGACQFDGQTYNDIWYQVTAPCTGELTVSTCNSADYDSDLVLYDGCDCANLSMLSCNDDQGGCSGFTSEVSGLVTEGQCYLVRVGGYQSQNEGTGDLLIGCGLVSGACCTAEECLGILTEEDCTAQGGTDFHPGTLSCAVCGSSAGPDVIYSDITSIQNYGAIGGVRGYALDSFTCNIGDANLLWGTSNNGTPVLAMNAFRLHDDRLEQIGMGWVKHACCAIAGSGCGLACNGQAGDVLGVGCRDVYSAGWNGSQSRLGPRSDVNPYSGAMLSAPSDTGNAIYKRLQIRETELNLAGAEYYVEGVYVGSDDAPAGNGLNNATYRQVTVDGSFNLSVTGAANVGVPAIFAWSSADAEVSVETVDVPDEGRFFLANKVSDLGGGNWRYTYALYNLNSHRSAGTLEVPIPDGVTVDNIGFNDVDYHSGEPYDNTDWSSAVAGGVLTWSSPETFVQNPNSNALRWATMYTFWFDADAPPAGGDVTIGLFRSGTPAAVSVASAVPQSGVSCPADLNDDGLVDAADLAILLGAWGSNPGNIADLNGDDIVDAGDLALVLGAWGPCKT